MELTQERKERHEMRIVNPNPRYPRATLVEPATLGYIFLAAEVHPRPAPFVPNGREKSRLLARLTSIAHQLESLAAVEKVTVFDAIAFAPPSAYVKRQIEQRPDAIQVPRFDVVVLIETSSPAAAREVQTAPAYQALTDALRDAAKRLYIIVARNIKRIADVDKSREGVFLFNYFVADDTNVMLDVWDYLAGWYAVETGLDNSTLLAPIEGERSDYLAINNARWDGSPLGIMLRQLAKPSFRSYMLANLEANHVGAMPVLYRVTGLPRRTTGPRPSWALPAAAAIALAAGLALRRRRVARR